MTESISTTTVRLVYHQIYAVFMKILKQKIYSILDSQQPVEQGGFHKNYNTIDHIQKPNLNFQIKIAMMFVDVNKASDSLYHNYLVNTRKKVSPIRDF